LAPPILCQNLTDIYFYLKSSKADQLKRFKAARKVDADSLYTGIDMILKTYGINRAEYHGGDLTGVHVKKLMENAEKIMTDIRGYLIGSLHPDSNETEDSITETCNNFADLLTLWDAVLSNLHIRFPSVAQCAETQVYIEAAIKLSHEMGMSKTVKGHGSQRHIVNQMRRVYGGLPEFDEQWAERIHQVGKKADMRLRNLDEGRAALSRATTFRRVTRPETKFARTRLTKYKRGQRKRTRESQEAAQRVKKERRSAVKPSA